MRDDRTGRRWTVALRPFEISRFPVTQAQYAALTGMRPSAFAGDICPVESVSWLDATKYCNLLSTARGLHPYYVADMNHVGAIAIEGSNGYCLPSEADWEYACRAGTNTPRYGELETIAWYDANAQGHVQEVGQKQPNAWGIHDMLGNVWEWCDDLYDPQVYGAYRVFRGGGWADAERGCLATNRRRSHPTFKIDDLGFRVARSLSAPLGPSNAPRKALKR